MKKRPVTQKQIAKQAGVSQTLVSLVLNDSYDVTLSDETRQRVLDVAAEMGYVPQAAAKSLVQGRSNNLGLVLIQPHYQIFRDPFIPNVITGLNSVVRSHDFRLLVEHIEDLSQLDTITRILKGGEVAGIILSSFSYGAENVVMPLVKEGFPIVLLDTAPEQCYTATIDHRAGVKSAAQHILSLGHQQIGCIAWAPPNPHMNKRISAFVETFAEQGIAIQETYMRYGLYDPESGYEAMQSILQMHPLPTAVFGMNDMMALGAMHAVLDAGLRVPEDIAIIGYDDMRFAAFTTPALTTVRAPEVEQGRVAGEMLVQLIAGDAVTEPQVALPTQLVIRASCGSELPH